MCHTHTYVYYEFQCLRITNPVACVYLFCCYFEFNFLINSMPFFISRKLLFNHCCYFLVLFFSSHAALSICSAMGIFLICFTTGNVRANPLASAETSIPRTEVLFSTLSNTGSAENTTQSTVKMNGTNICMTKGCVKASALILDLLDENVDPCENFYEFACGKFLKNTFIPDDKIAMMSFVQVQDKVLGQLRSVLNERSLANESKPFTLAKTFNVACMDEQTLEEKGKQLNPMKP